MITKFLPIVLINLLLLTSFNSVTAQTVDQAADVTIRISPINQTRILAGSRFDVRVEVNGAKPETLEVKVNGQPAAIAFRGSREERTNVIANRSAEVTYRNVAFNNPGAIEIQARAVINNRELIKTVTWNVLKVSSAGAKNVILFVGDGMSFPSVTASRIVAQGLTEGKYNAFLEMDRMQYRGAVTTSGYDALVTSSANGSSAFATGHKAVDNTFGLYADNTADPFDNPKVENLIEMLKRSRQMSTGLVTTADLTDATTAAFAAHNISLSQQAYVASTYFDPLRRPDVLMGGGASWFLPKSKQGVSLADRDLVDSFKSIGYGVATNRTELRAVTTDTQKILGLFHPTTMNTYLDREIIKDQVALGGFRDQPSLIEMTDTAIKALSQNPNGFFLMVEGGSIGKQLQQLDWLRGVYDNIEMDKAVGVAKRFQAQNADTLIIVTSNRGVGISVYGTYGEQKTRDAIGLYGNSLLPTFTYSQTIGLPDSPTPSRTLAIGFATHPEYYLNLTNPLKNPTSPTIEDPANKGNYLANPQLANNNQKIAANLPANQAQAVSSADDVPIMASGPGAERVNGLLDNTDVFFIIANALGLDPTANDGRSLQQTIMGGTFGDPTNPFVQQGGGNNNQPTATPAPIPNPDETPVPNETPAPNGEGEPTAAAGSGGIPVFPNEPPTTAIGNGEIPNMMPDSGTGNFLNTLSKVPLIFWVLWVMIGLGISFGCGMVAARRMTRK